MHTPRERVLPSALGVSATAFVLLCMTLRVFKSGIIGGFEVNLLFVLLILTAAGLYVMRWVLEGRGEWTVTGTEWAALAFAAMCVVSVCVAGNKRAAFGVAANWLAYLVLFYLVLHCAQQDGAWRVMAATLIATAVAVSVYGMYQFHVDWSRSLEEFRRIQTLYHNDVHAIARHLQQYIHVDVTPDGIADYEGRLMRRQAYSTFVLPHSFAGYLILLLPGLVGLLVDLWRRPRTRGALVGLAACGLCGCAMVLSLGYTRSKGAWLCLVLGAGGWMALRCRTWLRRRWRLVVGVLLIVVALFAGLQLRGVLPEAGEYMGSFAVRMDYWRGAALTWKDHPWLGVGLNGFSAHYGHYMRPEDDESIRVHNNYLQIACEMGILGLAAFVAFGAAFARATVGVPVARLPGGESGERVRALVVLGGIMGLAAFAMEHVVFGTLDRSQSGWPWHSFQALLAGVWLLTYIAIVAAPRERIGPGLKEGIMVGLGCFLLHSAIDIDIYVPSLTQTAWAMAGVAAALCAITRGKARAVTWSMGPATQLAAAGVVMAGCVAVALGFMPRVMRAKVHREQALAYEHSGRLEPALAEWMQARMFDRWDPKSALRLARTAWVLAGDRGDPMQQLQLLRLALAAAQAAATLNPASAACRSQQGQVLEKTAYLLQRVPAQRGQFKTALQHAAARYEEAISLFPSKPVYHYRAAMVYDALGQRPRAVDRFREAMTLSARQRLPRNQLTKRQIEHALKRVEQNSREGARSSTNGS